MFSRVVCNEFLECFFGFPNVATYVSFSKNWRWERKGKEREKLLATRYQPLIKLTVKLIMIDFYSMVSLFPPIISHFNFAGTTKRSSQDYRKPESIWWNYSEPWGRGGDVPLSNPASPAGCFWYQTDFQTTFFESRWLSTKEPTNFPHTLIGWQIPKSLSPHQTDQEQYVHYHLLTITQSLTPVVIYYPLFVCRELSSFASSWRRLSHTRMCTTEEVWLWRGSFLSVCHVVSRTC